MIPARSIVFSELENTIKELNLRSISAERRVILQPLIDFVQAKTDKGNEVHVNFICTHNSRRSHLTQVWAQTFSTYFNIKNVFCYSGGTEYTALFPVVAKILRNSGFKVNRLSEGSNPIYSIKYSPNAHPIIGFSKKLNDDFNPKSEFAAVLTCSQADEACPFVSGADKRISIPYEDPKIFDNSLLQVEKYNETNIQIATELFYVFSQITL